MIGASVGSALLPWLTLTSYLYCAPGTWPLRTHWKRRPWVCALQFLKAAPSFTMPLAGKLTPAVRKSQRIAPTERPTRTVFSGTWIWPFTTLTSITR